MLIIDFIRIRPAILGLTVVAKWTFVLQHTNPKCVA